MFDRAICVCRRTKYPRPAPSTLAALYGGAKGRSRPPTSPPVHGGASFMAGKAPEQIPGHSHTLSRRRLPRCQAHKRTWPHGLTPIRLSMRNSPVRLPFSQQRSIMGPGGLPTRLLAREPFMYRLNIAVDIHTQGMPTRLTAWAASRSGVCQPATPSQLVLRAQLGTDTAKR
jgi:hypothetical protein